jgi:hypothetical protein
MTVVLLYVPDSHHWPLVCCCCCCCTPTSSLGVCGGAISHGITCAAKLGCDALSASHQASIFGQLCVAEVSLLFHSTASGAGICSCRQHAPSCDTVPAAPQSSVFGQLCVAELTALLRNTAGTAGEMHASNQALKGAAFTVGCRTILANISESSCVRVESSQTRCRNQLLTCPHTATGFGALSVLATRALPGQMTHRELQLHA